MDVTFRLESIRTAVFGPVDDDNNSDGTDRNVFKLLAGVRSSLCVDIFTTLANERTPIQNLLRCAAAHTHTMFARCQAGMANESRKIQSK